MQAETLENTERVNVAKGSVELREAFGNKIALEYMIFKKQLIDQGAEEVFRNAYKIDVIINLYEALLEMAESFSMGRMHYLMAVPDLLETLYEGWLEVEDSQADELNRYLKKCVKEQEKI